MQSTLCDGFQFFNLCVLAATRGEPMDEKLQEVMDRLRARNERAQYAAERLKLKREEIAKIEAAKGASDISRAVLEFLEKALAYHCECLEVLIEQAEHLSHRE